MVGNNTQIFLTKLCSEEKAHNFTDLNNFSVQGLDSFERPTVYLNIKQYMYKIQWN